MYWFVLLLWSAIICGKFTSALQNRIFFGNDTTIENHPYQVAVLHYGEFQCGGSLITSSIVLTAAHCVEIEAVSISIRAGSNSQSSGGVVVPVAQYYMHPQYRAKTSDFDVAVLKLKHPVALDNHRVSTIELQPLGITVPDGTEATVTGWGRTQTSKVANVLQSAILKKVSQAKCARLLIRSPFPLTSHMTCYARLGEKTGVCHGDSGGPLVVNGKQVGIVSWGIVDRPDCGNPRYPDVFARIEDKSINQFIQYCVKQFN